jgi:hypothetical protein
MQIILSKSCNKIFLHRFIINMTHFKYVTVAFFVLICSAFLYGSCSKEEPQFDQPTLVLDPNKADFGVIDPNDPIAFHEFSISAKNAGKETLQIEDIELPDGFSYEFVPRRNVIEGGDKLIMKITMDIRRFSGPVSDTAYVLCNMPGQPRVPIALQADVRELRADEKSSSIADAPDIEFDHRAFDFGSIARSKMVEHRFPFRNIGDKTLKILGIDTMCMCVTAFTTKTEILPGDSAEIVARLEPYKYEGTTPWKTLGITTNDPKEPVASVSVAAKIIDEAVLEPDTILLPHVQAGQKVTAQTKLLQKGAGKLLIKKIESSSPSIQVENSVLEEGDIGYLLDVTVLPDMPVGKFDEVVTVFTNYSDYSYQRRENAELYKDYSRLRLSIKGNVSGVVSMFPQKINFGSCTPGDPVKRKLTLTSTSQKFRIQSISCDNPSFRVIRPSSEPAQKHEVTIEFIPQPPEGEISGALVIVTDEGELTVPIFAAVKQVS